MADRLKNIFSRTRRAILPRAPRAVDTPEVKKYKRTVLIVLVICIILCCCVITVPSALVYQWIAGVLNQITHRLR